jgi:hypothetical protein
LLAQQKLKEKEKVNETKKSEEQKGKESVTVKRGKRNKHL